MRAALLLFDRTAVLFLGVAAGVAIGYAFGVRQAADAPVAVDGAGPGAGVIDAGPSDLPSAPRARGAIPGPPAQAETRPIQPGIVNAIRDGRPVRVGVFGDSFGDGIWSALYDQLSRKAGYQVIKYSQQATGFTRYRTLNLEEHDRNRLAAAPVDVAVISFGANDMMGVADGGHVYALLTPRWKAAIARRVTAYIAMLRAQGAIVYWVGLPKMREAAYDADAARMNAFYRDLMGQLGVVFIDTASYSVDADGRYTAYLPDPASGRPILMRANDGIHMSFKGYVRITRGLAGRIRSYVDQARARAGGDAPPPPVVAPAPLEAPPARPVAKGPPKLEDPLAGQPGNAAAAVPDDAGPPANGAPVDLLPPDLRDAEPTPQDNGQ
jgi:hypothetical protein